MSGNATKQFYDRISHAYDMIADGGEHVAREQGLTQLNVQPGEAVLEIGYGTGHSLVTLIEAVSESGSVSGIDISSGMKEVSEKRLKDTGYEGRANLLVQSAPPLPFPDHSFDVVVMSFTLELFPLDTIPALLAECKRVLKPTGRLGVTSMATVESGNNASVLEKTYIWMHTHFPHIVDCQPIPLENLVQQAGFHLTHQERIDLFSMPVAIVVAQPEST